MKLGGIIRPNDGQCHLDPQNGMYLEATSQDYPSLGQISQLVKNHSLNVIFAVTEKVQSGYQEFSRYISGSRVGTLDENSENIVELIHDIYQVNLPNIVSTIDFSLSNLNFRLGYCNVC